MPAKQETVWPMTTVGWIVLGSVVALVAVLALFLRASGLGVVSNKLTVRTYFANAEGLQTGAEVDLDGVTIGTVKSISITTDPEREKTPVQVVMKLDDAYQSSLHEDSTASLTTVGVLGDTAIDIDSNVATGPPLQDGDELHTLDEPNINDAMKAGEVAADSMGRIETKLNKIVDGLEAGKGSVGQFINDKGFADRLQATTNGVQELRTKLNGKDSTAGRLVNDSSLQNKLASVAKDFSGLHTLAASRAGGELETNLAETSKQSNALLAGISSGQGSVGMLIKDPAMSRNIAQMTRQTSALIQGINQQKGTLGKLAGSDELTRNLTALSDQSSALATMIRSNPKKYLTIEFRIF